jgi:hypothetical protein
MKSSKTQENLTEDAIYAQEIIDVALALHL